MDSMDVGVLGTGTVGRSLAGRLSELKHRVVIGTRDPERTRGREDETRSFLSEHPAVRLATFAEAAAAGELVINACNGAAAIDVLTQAGADHLAGKVLVDVSNPLDFSQGFPPTLFVKDTDSLGEQIQRAFPDARVVKALNTLNADLMAHPEQLAEPTTVFVSGDDVEAKVTVTQLLQAFGHADVVDMGDISTARGTEMYVAWWVRAMGALGTATFNIRVVR
jgi:predicted dinucleotide-binding enzyme